MRRPARLALLVLALLAGACSGGDDDGGPDASPRPTDTPVTAVVDYSGMPLARVPGSTTTTVREQGTASIVGSVAGPGGLIAGATVRIEHLVRGDAVRTDVLTGPDGRFELRNVPGGRYRVRAFLAPSLAQTVPDVRFLRDGEEHAFDVVAEDQRGVVARGAAAPDPPVLLEPVNLVVLVASRSVDADGIVRSTPVVGVRVELAGLGRWSFRQTAAPGANRPLLPRGSTTTSTTVLRAPDGIAFTDAFGQVRFELECDVVGPAGLSLLVPVTVQPAALPGEPIPPPTSRLETISLDLPECIDPAAVPEPAVDTGTDGAEG